VVYFSSFCKVLSPSLRLGWIAADPPLLKALLREKIYSVMATAALSELVLLEVLAAGRWRKHLDRLHARVAAARRASLRHLRGAGIAFEYPSEAGMFLWGELPAGVDVDELVADAGRNHILLAGGAAFRVGREADPHVRFNVAICQQPRVADYLRGRLQAIESVRGAMRNAGGRSCGTGSAVPRLASARARRSTLPSGAASGQRRQASPTQLAAAISPRLVRPKIHLYAATRCLLSAGAAYTLAARTRLLPTEPTRFATFLSMRAPSLSNAWCAAPNAKDWGSRSRRACRAPSSGRSASACLPRAPVMLRSPLQASRQTPQDPSNRPASDG
jgi:hypothetical protein